MKRALVGAVSLITVGLMSCSTVPEEDPAEEAVSAPLVDSRGRELPAGAIEVGDDVYMVPAGGAAGSTCQSYHLYSPIKRVNQSIYYRTADGRFVRNRAEAECLTEVQDDN